MHKTWNAARLAQKILNEQEIHGVLVGTMALVALGELEYSEEMDVDFFVDSIPTGADIQLMERMPGTYKHLVAEWFCGDENVKVQFIRNDRDEAQRFLTQEPRALDGINIADLKDILGLKKWGNRQKDRDFFIEHPELASLVEDVEPSDNSAEWA